MAAGDDSLLNEGEVRRIAQEVARNRDDLEHARLRLAESERKLGAIEVLIGRARLEQIVGSLTPAPVAVVERRPPVEAPPDKRPWNDSSLQAAAQGVEVAWTDWVLEALENLGGAATSPQLIKAARADPRMAARFKQTPNGYYNGLGRVLHRKKIKKVGLVYALPNVEVNEPEKGEASPKGGPLFN